MILEIIAQFWYVWAFFVGFFVVRKVRKKEVKEGAEILVIGHRGAKGYAPDNSEESFKKAVEIGVDYVECDIRKNADLSFYLSHDAKVKYINLKKKEIAKLTDEEIEMGVLKNGLRLLSLDEFFKMIPPTQKVLLDLKDKGCENELVKFITKKKLTERVIISSFYWESLRLIKVLDQRLTVGVSYPKDRFKYYQYFILSPLLTPLIILVKYLYPFYIGLLCRYAKADFVAVSFRFVLSRRLIKAAHKRNILVLAFSVNNRRNIRKMIKWGVDGIISNYPDRVKEIINNK